MLLDAGADPNDAGDDERIGVIGWTTFFPQHGEISKDVVSLLVERGCLSWRCIHRRPEARRPEKTNQRERSNSGSLPGDEIGGPTS